MMVTGTAEQLLEKAATSLDLVNPTNQIRAQFNSIKNTFQTCAVEDSFVQFKKSDSGSGLALELLFFSEDMLVDMVVSSDAIHYYMVPLRSVTSLALNIENQTKTNDQKELVINEKATLTIEYSTSESGFYYTTDLTRFEELLRVSGSLRRLLKMNK